MKRNKKLRKTFTRILAGVMSVAVMVPATPLWAAQERMTTAPSVGEVSVSPEIRYQTLKGWGTSLCWWGNVIGSWGDSDFNKNGRPDREEIAELAFSPEYLNLNIVRYNVGGGDKEDTSIKRCEGVVPGWTEDMTGKKDGTGTYNETAFLAKTTEQMADAGQLWMLEEANRWRKETAEQNGTDNDIINEVFSNSPPYYMTKSGSSTGGNNDDLNNLRDDQYEAFATYLARAAKWIDKDLTQKYGTNVDYIEPLNEPDTSYWKNGSTKQEGCIFNTGELQSKAYQEMKKALEAENLGSIQITGTDETDLETAIKSYNRLADDVKQNMTTIGTHTYSGNDSQRKELRRIAQSDDKDLWMSEVTKGGGWHDHNSMEAVNAKDQSEGIMADLKYMQPTAWIAWLLADSEYECIQTDESWGLIHATFEKDGKPVEGYHTFVTTDDANYKEGYWAVTKQLYTMMQYSKFLKQGYTMVDVEDGNMCAAVAPDGSELVLVAQNFGNARSTTVDLGKFTNIKTAEMYRTSDRENCQKMAYPQDVSDHVLDVDLPKNSVTTYVIKAETGKTVCDMDSSAKTVDADVVKGAEWASDIDKFQYTGKWGESGSCDGKYATADGTAVTFKFEGTRTRIYGTKGDEGGNVEVSVDGGNPATVDLSGSGKNVDALLFDTGKLESGEHTVVITRKSGLLEVNYAQVINGNYNLAEVQPCEPVNTIAGVAPILPEKVAVTIGDATEERKVSWNTDDVDFSKTVTVKGNVSGTSQKASIVVNVVEAKSTVVYFIDCNSPESAELQKYDSLLNEKADQKYGVDGNTWGYVEDYKNHSAGNADIYESGWYSKGKGPDSPIQYRLPLKAGNYRVTVGSKEWWTEYNNSRPMKVSVKQGEGAETELGTTNSYNKNGNNWNTDIFTFACSEDADVVFSIRAAKSDQDAVLSFLKFEEVLNLDGLKAALKKFQAIDESKYAAKPQELAALKKAAADGHKLLYLETATQEDVDAAAAEIENKIAALGKIEVVLNAQTLEANDYVLYTANCGTPDPYRIPNKESERLGLLQSTVDQALGEDNMTGYVWGRDADTEYSQAKPYGEGDAMDIGNSFIYMGTEAAFDKDKSTLGYTFAVPDLSGVDGMETDTYEVTVAFKQPWGDKNVNVLLEGRTYATDLSFGKNQWVCRTFTTQVKDGSLNVQVKNPRRKSGDDDPVLNYIKVRAVKHTEPQITTYDSISGTQGAPLYDTEGKLIQAHGGQIQQFTVNGVTKWYWIGEDKTYDYRPCGGIHMYSSEDLYNWQDEGVILKTMESMEEFEADSYFKNLYGKLSQEEKENVFEDLDRNNCVMERPKMLYNDKTGKYVIWFHADGRTRTNPDADYGKAKAGVAIGDSPTGPFRLLGSYKLNHTGDSFGYDGYDNRGSVRDMNLFKDDDGTAYVIYSSEGNQTTYISKLNEEYTNIAGDRENGEPGVDFIRAFSWSREAPAPFKYNGKYYIINSGCTGWSPNQAECWMADDIFGEWKPMGDPCPDWGNGTTYDTQSTCVIPVDPKKGYYIYMGDRWNAGDLSESRYVWLPIEFQEDNGKAVLKRKDNWKLEEVWDMSAEADTTKLQAAIEAAEAVDRNKDDYTSESWSDYENALAGAKALLANPGKFQITVDNATHALESAVQRLKTLVEALDDALEAYGTIPGNREDYTADSLKAYDEALKAAKDLQEAGNFTEAQMDEAVGRLEAAFQGLKPKKADISELQQIVEQEEAENRKSSDYTAVSWKAYDDALKAAKELLKTPGEDQEAVDNAAEALRRAVEGLKTLKSLLGTALDTYAVNPDSQGEYTESSWQAYAAALKTVQDLQEADGVTEGQADAAIKELKNKYFALVKNGQEEPEEPKTPEEALDKYGTPEGDESQYTPESWERYQNALQAVKAMQESGDYTEEELQQAIKELSEAYQGLKPKKADISELQQIVEQEEAENRKSSDYTAVSWKAYDDALKAAKELLKTPGEDQEAVNRATAALKKAAEGLTTIKSLLGTALDAYAVNPDSQGEYTESSWQAYAAALKTVQDLQEADGVTEEQADAAIKELKNKYFALVKNGQEEPEEPKTPEEALDKYGTPEGDESQYTPESWERYQNALQAVKAMQESGDYTEEELQQAIKELSEAYKGLAKAEPESPSAVLVNKIMVTGTTDKILIGKKTVLKADVLPADADNRAVKWETSNAKVAAVDAQGTVTGNGAGTATITAAAMDGSGVKGTYVVTVTDAVTKITLSSGTKGIAAGKKVTVKPTIKVTGKTANKKLAWTSSNKKYATVNAKGVVTTQKAGAGKNVTITATATDGSGVSGKVKIKIVKHSVKKITLKCKNKTVKPGKKVTIKATVKTTGKNANKTLAWSSSNKKYATVSSKGVVTAKKAGKGKTVTITARATDGTGKKARVKIKIKK